MEEKAGKKISEKKERKKNKTSFDEQLEASPSTFCCHCPIASCISIHCCDVVPVSAPHLRCPRATRAIGGMLNGWSRDGGAESRESNYRSNFHHQARRGRVEENVDCGERRVKRHTGHTYAFIIISGDDSVTSSGSSRCRQRAREERESKRRERTTAVLPATHFEKREILLQRRPLSCLLLFPSISGDRATSPFLLHTPTYTHTHLLYFAL